MDKISKENEEYFKSVGKDLVRKPLKELKIEDIEKIIAKALGDAVGREYEGDITSITFPSPVDDAEITISIKRTRGSFIGP